MEFVELFQKIIENISPQFENIKQSLQLTLPYIVLIFAGLTCFFGYKLHKLWIVCSFATGGFFLSAVTLMLLFPSMNTYWAIAFGIVTGILTGFFSHKLFHASLVVTNGFLAFFSADKLLASFLPEFVCILLAVAVGIAAGILVTKYKYLVVMTVTAVTGAATAIPVLFSLTNYNNTTVRMLLICTACAGGICTQFLLEKKHIRAHIDEIKTKAKNLRGKVQEIKK